MEIALAIIGTLVFDWGLGAYFKWKELKDKKFSDMVFQLELEDILKDKKIPRGTRKENALYLCRNTKGELAAGAYLALTKFNLD